MKEWDWQHDLKDKWIYESPDGGSTVTKRPFLAESSERIVIQKNGKQLDEKDQHSFYSWLK